jgi:5,10-methylenetetrahydromethanopterin reductase
VTNRDNEARASGTQFWLLNWPTWGQSAAFAAFAEQSGWNGIVMTDTQCLASEVYVQLALAANATEHVALATGVTNPVTRHAAVTASAIASLQIESNGRAHLGIGRGDSALAYIGRSPASVDALARYVTDLQLYLSGEAVDLGGPVPSRIRWLPVPDLPKVPVEVSGTGPRVVRLAAELADCQRCRNSLALRSRNSLLAGLLSSF